MTNAEIANRLLSLVQVLAAKRENPFKIKAYRRAARTISEMGQSVEEPIRTGEDLTRYSGIGGAIQQAIQEIVSTGSLRRLDLLRSSLAPEVASLSDYPLLDPSRIRRIYKSSESQRLMN